MRSSIREPHPEPWNSMPRTSRGRARVPDPQVDEFRPEADNCPPTPATKLETKMLLEKKAVGRWGHQSALWDWFVDDHEKRVRRRVPRGSRSDRPNLYVAAHAHFVETGLDQAILKRIPSEQIPLIRPQIRRPHPTPATPPLPQTLLFGSTPTPRRLPG